MTIRWLQRFCSLENTVSHGMFEAPEHPVAAGGRVNWNEDRILQFPVVIALVVVDLRC